MSIDTVVTPEAFQKYMAHQRRCIKLYHSRVIGMYDIEFSEEEACEKWVDLGYDTLFRERWFDHYHGKSERA
jgi:hypothetical protein